MKQFLRTSISLAVVVVASVALVMLGSSQALAAPPSDENTGGACGSKGDFFGFPSWDSCLPKGENGEPIITKLQDVWLIAFPIVETMIRAAGYLAVGFIIFGGIKFIRSQGEPANIASARTIITNAVVGLVIAILSVTIVRFIADRFTSG